MLQLIRQILAPKSTFWWLATGLCFVIIFYFSLIRTPGFNQLAHWFWGNLDKLGHSLAYFALSFSLIFALAKVNGYLVLAIFALSLLFEGIQSVLPLRQFDYFDLIANAIGGLIALTIASILIKNQEF